MNIDTILLFTVILLTVYLIFTFNLLEGNLSPPPSPPPPPPPPPCLTAGKQCDPNIQGQCCALSGCLSNNPSCVVDSSEPPPPPPQNPSPSCDFSIYYPGGRQQLKEVQADGEAVLMWYNSTVATGGKNFCGRNSKGEFLACGDGWRTIDGHRGICPVGYCSESRDDQYHKDSPWNQLCYKPRKVHKLQPKPPILSDEEKSKACRDRIYSRSNYPFSEPFLRSICETPPIQGFDKYVKCKFYPRTGVCGF